MSTNEPLLTSNLSDKSSRRRGGGEQSISWGLIAVLVIVLLVQATKKISSHRTNPDSLPSVYVTPPPGEEQPSLSATTETTGQR
jgi:hypothetical protein